MTAPDTVPPAHQEGAKGEENKGQPEGQPPAKDAGAKAAMESDSLVKPAGDAAASNVTAGKIPEPSVGESSDAVRKRIGAVEETEGPVGKSTPRSTKLKVDDNSDMGGPGSGHCSGAEQPSTQGGSGSGAKVPDEPQASPTPAAGGPGTTRRSGTDMPRSGTAPAWNTGTTFEPGAASSTTQIARAIAAASTGVAGERGLWESTSKDSSVVGPGEAGRYVSGGPKGGDEDKDGGAGGLAVAGDVGGALQKGQAPHPEWFVAKEAPQAEVTTMAPRAARGDTKDGVREPNIGPQAESHGGPETVNLLASESLETRDGPEDGSKEENTEDKAPSMKGGGATDYSGVPGALSEAGPGSGALPLQPPSGGAAPGLTSDGAGNLAAASAGFNTGTNAGSSGGGGLAAGGTSLRGIDLTGGSTVHAVAGASGEGQSSAHATAGPEKGSGIQRGTFGLSIPTPAAAAAAAAASAAGVAATPHGGYPVGATPGVPSGAGANSGAGGTTRPPTTVSLLGMPVVTGGTPTAAPSGAPGGLLSITPTVVLGSAPAPKLKPMLPRDLNAPPSEELSPAPSPREGPTLAPLSGPPERGPGSGAQSSVPGGVPPFGGGLLAPAVELLKPPAVIPPAGVPGSSTTAGSSQLAHSSSLPAFLTAPPRTGHPAGAPLTHGLGGAPGENPFGPGQKRPQLLGIHPQLPPQHQQQQGHPQQVQSRFGGASITVSRWEITPLPHESLRSS